MERLWSGLSAVLRARRSEGDEALIASLTTGEWSEIVDTAIRQGVASHVLATVLPPLPADAAARLHERTVFAADRTRRYQEAFLELAAAVQPQGVPLVALKGMHLSLAVYSPPIVREMADLDVLVRHDQLDVVAGAARRLGFVDHPASLNRNPHHLPPLVRRGLSLEIHWRLAESGEAPDVAPEQLWAHVTPLASASNTFTLAPEDALIHVCAHAVYSHHLEQGLRPLCDIRALTNTHDVTLDWSIVVARARRWNCHRGVALGLSLARDLVGAVLPDDALRALGSAPPPDVTAAATTLVFGPRTAMHTVGGSAGDVLAGTTRERLRAGLRAMILPREQIEVLYPHRSPDAIPVRARVMGRRVVMLAQRYGQLLIRAALRPDSPERRHIAQRHRLRRWLIGTSGSA